MSEATRPARRGRRWSDPVLAEAAERFPKAFACFGSRPRPLKLRVEKDLARFMPEVSVNRIRRALETYCGTRWYLEAIAAGGTRVDLFGRDCGEVDAGARQRALERLVGDPRPAPSGPGEGRPRLGIKGTAGLDVRLAIARTRGFRV